ncbi:sulfatase [Halobacterium salinarum]|uniref:sulfatase n=1 Tax=Halobacterium salinarum TaxID=2242 RepID=UPI00255454DE|nr:sulfatase [Halobacterium salinarum]MDL0134831.1 sulfatase [Halobacterium salinarum]
MNHDGPVVLLTIDTLRADRCTPGCFPKSFPIFEREFARFGSAISHGNATPHAFPGVMTGYPVVGNGEFRSGATTIAETLEVPSSGFSNNAHLTDERGYDRGFDRFHDLSPPDSRSPVEKLKRIEPLRDSEIVVKAYRILRRLRDAAKTDRTGGVVHPFPNPKTTADVVTEFVVRRLGHDDGFVWGHYMDPHKPFHPDQAVDGPEIDRSYEEIERLNSYEHTKDPIGDDDMAFLEALYDSNVRYLDRELARLFETMRQRGVYDDALIIVVGDHGELFGEHGLMFHPMDVDPVDELVRTPLLVKYPGGAHAGETFDHLVQHADVLATITRVTGASSAAIPETAHPLTETESRRVISKSNTSIRLTEPDGVAFSRRDGSESGVEGISEEGRELLEDAEFPAVETTSGTVKGVEEAERRRRLEALGYQ